MKIGSESTALRRTYLYRLSGLRFLAASYTIFFHYWNLPDWPLLSRVLAHGHIAVPFFFMLSGFVLFYQKEPVKGAGALQFDTRNFLLFLKLRWIRLAPTYYAALVLAIPLLVHSFQQRDGFSWIESLGSVVLHVLMLQSWIPANSLIQSWNVHTWSLSVEIFLHLCAPFCWLWVFSAKKISKWIFGLLAIQALLFSGLNLEDSEWSWGFFPPLFIAMFVFGMFLARLYLLYSASIDAHSGFLFLLACLMLSLMLGIDFEPGFYSALNPAFQVGFALLILGSVGQNRFNGFLGSKMMVSLGAASYAMYLFQAPVKLATQQIWSKVLGQPETSGVLYGLTIYFTVVAVSWLWSRFAETRLRESLKLKLAGR